MNKRKFLYEYISDLYKVSPDNKCQFIEELRNNKRLSEFFDITYNKNYNWEFDNKFKVKPRNNRDNGGDVMGWYDAVKLVKRMLVKNTNQSQNFTKRLERILETCNYKDIQIILCSLKNRSIKYINTKSVYEYFPEYNVKDE